MRDSKKTPEGYLQRLALLQVLMGSRAVTELICELDAQAGVAKDDILDAMVCGYVARLDVEKLCALPRGDVERNERGDAMQIWFPSAHE